VEHTVSEKNAAGKLGSPWTVRRGNDYFVFIISVLLV
jgi:hypothetical protein